MAIFTEDTYEQALMPERFATLCLMLPISVSLAHQYQTKTVIHAKSLAMT